MLSEAIAGAADEPDAVRHFAGRMSTETARLNELISQIIALSRLQSSDPLLAAVPIEIDEVADAVLDQFRDQADSHQIVLSHQRTPGSPSAAIKARSRRRCAIWCRTRSPTPKPEPGGADHPPSILACW